MTAGMKLFRLIWGASYTYAFFYYANSVPLHTKRNFERGVYDFLTSLIGDWGEFFGHIFMAFFSLYVFYIGAIGIFRILTYNHIPEWAEGVKFWPQLWDAIVNFDIAYGYDDKKSEYRNIESVKGYRDAKLGTMGNQKASEEYLKTAHLDGVMNANGKNTRDAIGHLDAKLGTMSNQQGYEYIKEKYGG